MPYSTKSLCLQRHELYTKQYAKVERKLALACHKMRELEKLESTFITRRFITAEKARIICLEIKLKEIRWNLEDLMDIIWPINDAGQTLMRELNRQAEIAQALAEISQPALAEISQPALAEISQPPDEAPPPKRLPGW